MTQKVNNMHAWYYTALILYKNNIQHIIVDLLPKLLEALILYKNNIQLKQD